MKKELQDNLYNKYPAIFKHKDLDPTQTAMCWGISCGDGWFNIIDTLCCELQTYVETPQKNLDLYTKFRDESEAKNDPENVEFWSEKMERERKQLMPQVHAVQVKEKFGSLCFYVDHYDPIISKIISFAGTMSEVTCETCGSPGHQSKGGWIKTLCTKCEEDR